MKSAQTHVNSSLSNFRCYSLSLEFHRQCRDYALPAYLKNQLLRAAASVSLNLCEGCGKPPGSRDRLRFYTIALGSLRESQAVLELAPRPSARLKRLADGLGGALYRLCYPRAPETGAGMTPVI